MKFTSEGRQIFKAPVETKRENGMSAFTLGFPIAEVMAHIKNGEQIAKAIAEALSASPLFDQAAE